MKEVFSEYAGALWAAVARTTWAAQMGTVKSTKNSADLPQIRWARALPFAGRSVNPILLKLTVPTSTNTIRRAIWLRYGRRGQDWTHM